MRLTACLTILSLILAYWSTGPGGCRTVVAPESQAGRSGPLVLEQLRNPPPASPWWDVEMWAERVFPSGRRRRRVRRWRKHKPGWLERRLRKFQRRCRQWQRLRRQWHALMEGTLPAQVPAATGSPAVRPVAGSGSAAGHVSPSVFAPPTPAIAEGVEAPAAVRRGPGRPRTIPTAHRCCPNEDCPAYGRFGDDPLHDIVGYGTYTTASGEVRQMYLCKVCRRPFSETAGTPFFGLKTPLQTVCTALQELAEGMGVRAVARIHKVAPDVVLEWLQKAGEHCQALSECWLHDLHVTQVQLDELWTFVRKKERMLKEWEQLHSEWGDTWVWAAFDPVHKLVLAVLIGERSEEGAVGLMARLRTRLADTCLPLLTSDSLPHYAGAILQVFGVWMQPQRQGERGRFPKPRQVVPEGLQYATVHKERQKGRVVAVTTRIVYGSQEQVQALLEALAQKINTAFIERFNLTLRHLVSRLHRETLCFSKEREYLVYHLHLVLAYYHFGRYHSGLRVKLPQPLPTRGNGSPKKWQQRTPAMAAGLTDHCWSLRELFMCPVMVASP